MIHLHHAPSTASMVPHILLEEIGLPYQRVLVDRAGGEHKRPDYLRLNPNGLIPVLVDGEHVVYETAAIVLHLCDAHPDAKLAPASGSWERAHFHQWLMWLTNTLQASLILYFYPERWMNEGNVAGAANIWAIEVAEGRTFAYELRRPGRFFRVDFDLSRPLAPPLPPWGSR